jgi:ATP-dependent DNA helicase RecQ
VDREAMQEQFMNDEVEIIVATSAFGMGVDKPNVRFVFHYEAPDSLDSYYQEIGRAGRDGEPASAVLFYCAKDLTLHKFFAGGGRIEAADVEAVLDVITNRSDANLARVQKATKITKIKLSRVLQRLEDARMIEVQTDGIIHPVTIANVKEVAKEAAEAQSALHEAELVRIEQMRMYAEELECRRKHLLAYFGEEASPTCSNCDNCQGTGTTRAEIISEARARASEHPPA